MTHDDDWMCILKDVSTVLVMKQETKYVPHSGDIKTAGL